VANVPELVRQFRDWRPDVVVAYSISNAYLAMKLARMNQVPYVYHLMDALHTLVEPPQLRPLARAVERLVLKSADRVIVVNTQLKTYAMQMGADPSRIEVIPMGVTVRDAANADGWEARVKHGISETDFVLLFLGWLYKFSGLREVVLALATHRRTVPNVKLFVVGDGDLFPELHRLRHELKLEDQLILMGRRSVREVPAYIAAADMCLLPAHRNVTMEHIVPAKVIEYMEHGKPVIATRLAGLEAEFGPLPGILYVDQPEQVIDQVRVLLSSPENARQLAAQLGKSCLQFIQDRESWDEVTTRFEALLSGAGLRSF
jgi:glycosyltransferase involved in cell wall biosynthesis